MKKNEKTETVIVEYDLEDLNKANREFQDRKRIGWLLLALSLPNVFSVIFAAVLKYTIGGLPFYFVASVFCINIGTGVALIWLAIVYYLKINGSKI